MPLTELLEPIPGDEPAGPDLSTSNEYAEIERAYRELTVPSGWRTDEDEPTSSYTFGQVAELATDFLGTQSKDVKIAAILAGALLREEGFSGLANGLELLHSVLDRYWDGLHPGVAARAAVLDFVGSKEWDLTTALKLAPLTTSRHTYFHYKDWVKVRDSAATEPADDVTAALQSDELSAANFGQGLAESSWAWYNELNASLGGCAAALEALDALGSERFKAAGERRPSYKDLKAALTTVTAAAEDLLSRKPPPASETAAVEGGAGAGTTAAAGGPTVAAEPRNPDEAAATVAVAARVIRRADPHSPASYLLLRGLRWGELRAAGGNPDPRDLVAPSMGQRTSLRNLELDAKWDELLEAVEQIMATPTGRGWLDLQRYAVIAAEGLGAEYAQVATALRSALRTLITDVPSLVPATLMDTTAAASRDTVGWLAREELLPPELYDRLMALDPLLGMKAVGGQPPRPAPRREPAPEVAAAAGAQDDPAEGQEEPVEATDG